MGGEQRAQGSLVQQWLIGFLFWLWWQRPLQYSKVGGQRHVLASNSRRSGDARCVGQEWAEDDPHPLCLFRLGGETVFNSRAAVCTTSTLLGCPLGRHCPTGERTSYPQRSPLPP